jgi:hypothetical protein
MRHPCPPDCPTCQVLARATIDATVEHGARFLTGERLAAAARVDVEAVNAHGPGSCRGWLEQTYRASAAGLQANFAASFHAGDSWPAGLRRATERLVSTLVVDPARARFTYVEVLEADAQLRLIREQVRRRSVRLFADRHCACEPTAEDLRPVNIELICSAIIHSIASHARENRIDELPDRLDDVLAVAGAGG